MVTERSVNCVVAIRITVWKVDPLAFENLPGIFAQAPGHEEAEKEGARHEPQSHENYNKYPPYGETLSR